MNKMRYNLKKQRGITIIEVLVAMLILAVGLLGMASLQVRAVSDTTNSSFRSIAIFYANDMADRIRANPAAEALGSYANKDKDDGSEKVGCLAIGGCSASDMALHDLWEWQQNISRALPAGEGEVATNGDVYTVTVSWNARVQAEKANGDQTNTQVTSVNFSFEP